MAVSGATISPRSVDWGEQLRRLRCELDDLQHKVAELQWQWSRDQAAGDLAEASLASRTPPRSDEPDEEIEDSIREYMERLLQSIGGSDSELSAPSLPSSPSSPELPVVRTADRLQAMEISSDASPAPLDISAPEGEEDAVAELPTLHVGSHRETDLLALRDLADVAAKTTRIEYESRRNAKQAFDKLLVTLVCLPCGMLLLYWSFVHRLGLAYVASSLAFFVAALWGAQSLRFLGKMVLGRLSLARLWHEYGQR